MSLKKYILCSFCVQSGKFYTWQNIFTRAPPVVPVTIIRYGEMVKIGDTNGEMVKIGDTNGENRRHQMVKLHWVGLESWGWQVVQIKMGSKPIGCQPFQLLSPTCCEKVFLCTTYRENVFYVRPAAKCFLFMYDPRKSTFFLRLFCINRLRQFL